jgi:hypothetical protein
MAIPDRIVRSNDESTKVYGEVNQPSMVWVTEFGEQSSEIRIAGTRDAT